MSYEFADGYRIRNQEQTHFITFTVVGWIDIFSRQCYRDLIIESLNYCTKEKGLQVGAFVIMSNHLHFIWTAPKGNLSNIIRDFKRHTSTRIYRLILEEPESRRHWLLHLFKFHGSRTNAN